MINTINSVGLNRTVQFKGVKQQQPVQEPQLEKKGMSKTTKTMLGLGALAAITVGGLLAKKHIDTKAIKKLIAKPKDFNETYYKDFIDNWVKKLNLEFDTKTHISLMSKNKMNKFLAHMRESGKPVTRLEKAYEHMSDNGIFAVITDSGKCHFRCLDPEKISLQVKVSGGGMENLKDIFAKGEIFRQEIV